MSQDFHSVMYCFVRSRQLEGTYSLGPEVGTWIVTSMRIMRGWGCPPETAWPYSTEHWPPQEPYAIDALAKESRIVAYQRVRNSSECKTALASMHAVSAAFDITEQWFSAINGMIEMPASNAVIAGSHTVCILGYDDNSGLFTFQNSWGAEWGDEGLGYLSYSFFDEYFSEAWIQFLPYNGRRRSSVQPMVLEIEWGVKDVFGGVLHGVELYDSERDECIGWAFTVCRDGFLDIEELFVRPMFRGTNNGNILTRMLRELAARIGLPLRLWVAHADLDQANLAIMGKIVKRLSLNLVSSDVQWAGLKGVG
jgi:roadblock/LC7 domain-containing protein